LFTPSRNTLNWATVSSVVKPSPSLQYFIEICDPIVFHFETSGQ
jgi:hypothetical protein